MNFVMNRPRLIGLLLVLMLLSIDISAQESRKSGLIGKVLVVDHFTPSEEKLEGITDLSNAFEIGYIHHFTDLISVAVPLKIGVARLPEIQFGDRIQMGSADAVLRLRYFSPERKLVPYVFAGAGIVIEANQSDPYTQIPVGLGIDYKLGSHGYLELQAEYRTTMSDIERNNLQYGIGYHFMLGKKEAQEDVPDDLEVMADADGDGVPDVKDKCPDLAGTVDMLGCPDSDGDGVSDLTDECPDEAGLKELMGCKDSDGDGFADIKDECPDEAGSLNGCPDMDLDGIADKEDNCPDVKGIADLGGCPENKDSDNDGVLDADDKCPDLSGPVMGCPDSDGDGIADRFDNCPDRAGTKASNGCPMTTTVTSDITTTEREVLDFAMQAVEFETGSSVLKTSSLSVLDQIIDILSRYPDHQLKISGHTDNIGDERNNLRLSEKRAKACLDYIRSQGVSDLRLSFYGYGETRPRADNDDSDGRRMNRRVEFDIFKK